MSSTAEPAEAGTGDPLVFAGAGGCGDDSACSTPFVSAPSSPSRDRDVYHHHGVACFYSAPASPTRGKDFGGGPGVLDFDFDFSSRFPSPSAAAMSSADELFCNGQIRPVRLAAALLQPQQPPSSPGSAAARPGSSAAEDDGLDLDDAASDERARFRGRSVRRKARSLSPFRTHWRRSPAAASAAPAPETEPAEEPAVTPAASRSSSSSSTASSASSTSSSSSRGSRRWGRGFLKDLLHRSKSDGGGGKTHHLPTAPPPPPASPSPSAAAPKRRSPSPSPAATRSSGAARGGRRRSAHERLYEARRAEAEEMRRRTNLPYRQGGFLLFGCIGLGHRSYGAVHGLARGLNAVSSRS